MSHRTAKITGLQLRAIIEEELGSLRESSSFRDGFHSFGAEPRVPNALFSKALARAAIASEAAARAASEVAAEDDGPANKECVLLCLRAEKDWKAAGDEKRAAAMHDMAWKHDKAMEKASRHGETFGLRKLGEDRKNGDTMKMTEEQLRAIVKEELGRKRKKPMFGASGQPRVDAENYLRGAMRELGGRVGKLAASIASREADSIAEESIAYLADLPADESPSYDEVIQLVDTKMEKLVADAMQDLKRAVMAELEDAAWGIAHAVEKSLKDRDR